jgi:probable HAF family extracellular repeat protein
MEVNAMSHDRRSILAPIVAASLITLSACQGSMQNVGQVPSAPMHGANSGSGQPSKGVKRPNTTGYTLTDLGALPGDSGSTVSRGLNGVSPFGGNPLNNAGQVAGTSISCPTSCSYTATLFSNGTVTNINTLNSSSSFATAVNASGQVVGLEERNVSCHCNDAFLYNNGSMQDINNNSLFPGGSAAIGINKSGQIVGTGATNSSTVHAFLFSNGTMTDINPFPGSSSDAVSINDSGQIIGSSGNTNLTGTWLLSNGTVMILSQTTTSFFINNNGQIVGQNSSEHGALYSNGTWKDLGTGPPGATGGAAFGINDSGQIVGFAGFPGSYHPFRPAVQHAIIFTGGGAKDLNNLIPPNSGYTLNFAVAINDTGQIAIDATNSSKQKRAGLLTPK